MPDKDDIQPIALKTLKQIITEISARFKPWEPANIVNVTRDDILAGLVRAFNRKSFNANHKLSVKFMGEDGVDEGGLKVECITLAYRQICNSTSICQGQDAKYIVMDQIAINDNKYELIGNIMAYGIAHMGILPRFFSQTTVEVFKNKSTRSTKCSIDEIVDIELRNKLSKLQKAENLEEFQEAKLEVIDLIEMAGCINMSMNIAYQGEMVQSLVNYIVVRRHSEAYEQLIAGLNLFGLLDKVTSNNLVEDVFLHKTEDLTTEVLTSLLDFQYSEKASNRRKQEEVTAGVFLDVLQDFEDEDKSLLHDLLAFITGHRQIPATGFTLRPTVYFNHRTDFAEDDHSAPFPKADTCSLKLTLPVPTKYEFLKTTLKNIITHCKTFTLL